MVVYIHRKESKLLFKSSKFNNEYLVVNYENYYTSNSLLVTKHLRRRLFMISFYYFNNCGLNDMIMVTSL